MFGYIMANYKNNMNQCVELLMALDSQVKENEYALHPIHLF